MFCKNSKNYNILINKKIIENILADLNSWGQTKDIFCSFFTENRRTFWGVCGLFIDSIWRDILSLTDSTYCLSPTEEEVIQEKAKVVAVSCGTEMLQFLAALAILHQDVNELKNSGQIRLFFNSNQCKIASAARNWIKFVPPRSSDDLLPSLLYKSLFFYALSLWLLAGILRTTLLSWPPASPWAATKCCCWSYPPTAGRERGLHRSGTVSRDCSHVFVIYKKNSTWASHEQVKTDSRNFSFSKRFLRKRVSVLSLTTVCWYDVRLVFDYADTVSAL